MEQPTEVIYDIPGSFEVQQETLRDILNKVFPNGYGDKIMIDIGCGAAVNTQKFNFKHSYYIDLLPPENTASPQPFIQTDALTYLQGTYRCDILFALDFIEHFTKERGYELLDLVERRVTSVAIFFTPLGDLIVSHPGEEYSPHKHWSGWMPKDFTEKGYSTVIFPKFHNPWSDGIVHGAFFAWKAFI
jgi:hypothetical protein